jgi:hypothetical protein
MDKINYYNFKVLFKLKKQIVSNIEFIHIFGESGNEVIVVTKDDNVFSYGNNSNGCLGLGHSNAITDPIIANDLCNKQIVDITSGYNFVIALSRSGQLYCWGSNSYGQLGNGSQNPKYNYKPIVINCLNGIIAKRVSCGYYHTIVLTDSGDVYSFGHNVYGECGNNGFNSYQLTPFKINGFNGHKIIGISCGKHHSLALTESGHVFGWGQNTGGQLGIGSNNNQSIPTKIISIDKIFINKISCGQSHSLLLSNDGHIYAFGDNSCGQIGNGNKTNQNIPIKIVKSVKFIDIVCDSQSNISMGLSQNNYCYVWGDCDNEVIEFPRCTGFKTFHDSFATYGKRKITYRPIYFNEKIATNRFVRNLSKAFNNSENSDLKIKIGDQFIYVQKWFLRNCCKHFESMFSKDWSESNSDVIEIKGLSYNVYYAFLKYIYSDFIELEDIEEVIDLLDLANSYLEEELKLKCVNLLENRITVENVCTLYSASVKFDCPELEDICFEFAIKKLDYIRKTDAFKQMSGEYCKRLFEKFIQFKTFQ